MARQSPTDNARKICHCKRPALCKHPWYVFYQHTVVAADGTRSVQKLRKRLKHLVGREPTDFADAKVEAERAIRAWKQGLDATTVLPGDSASLSEILEAYATRPMPTSVVAKYHRKNIPTVVVNGRPFGEWPAAAITPEALKLYKAQRPVPSGNREYALLRAMFNWAVLSDLLPATPFKKGNVTAVSLQQEFPRTRRLYPGEETALLAVAAPYLHDFIIAALETGCRSGELRSCQVLQILPSGELFLPGDKTKRRKARRVPISTRLRAVLDRRLIGPDGKPLPPEAYVFGDEIGRRLKSRPATMWENALLLANGNGKPPRSRAGKLDPTSRAKLRQVDLTIHDLRREAGSRWLDDGVSLAQIQEWLGHANISQTSTYLAVALGGGVPAMRRFEQARQEREARERLEREARERERLEREERDRQTAQKVG